MLQGNTSEEALLPIRISVDKESVCSRSYSVYSFYFWDWCCWTGWVPYAARIFLFRIIVIFFIQFLWKWRIVWIVLNYHMKGIVVSLVWTLLKISGNISEDQVLNVLDRGSCMFFWNVDEGWNQTKHYFYWSGVWRSSEYSFQIYRLRSY